ncbi:MAG TPA: DNA-processing protein DprA [Steroidobacteraceae bacterium]|nr:DNA-processing protein DprA [Steroidobacteraceae bacterium]
MQDLQHWAILARAPRLTARELRAALAALGDSGAACAGAAPEDAALRALLAAPPHLLREAGFAPSTIAWLGAPDRERVAADCRWLGATGTRIVHCLAADYPPLLQEVPDAPATLYVQGAPDCLLAAQLALVGSRNPTAVGRRTAYEFSASLTRAGLVITSGLALGIDAASHEGALDAGGRTVAVLGSGLDCLYPPEHRPLADRIAAGGALVSEFAPGTPPLKAHFPRRNRLISGLALGVLVVEAARHSGSLITARLAGEQGREVFALPGSIHNPLARGCHQLLKSGAKLVEEVGDVLVELRIPFSKQQLEHPPAGGLQSGAEAPTLDKDYKILLDALGFEPAGMDALVERTGLQSHSVASMLLILELEGRVAPHPGGRYLRL